MAKKEKSNNNKLGFFSFRKKEENFQKNRSENEIDELSVESENVDDEIEQLRAEIAAFYLENPDRNPHLPDKIFVKDMSELENKITETIPKKIVEEEIIEKKTTYIEGAREQAPKPVDFSSLSEVDFPQEYTNKMFGSSEANQKDVENIEKLNPTNTPNTPNTINNIYIDANSTDNLALLNQILSQGDVNLAHTEDDAGNSENLADNIGEAVSDLNPKTPQDELNDLMMGIFSNEDQTFENFSPNENPILDEEFPFSVHSNEEENSMASHKDKGDSIVGLFDEPESIDTEDFDEDVVNTTDLFEEKSAAISNLFDAEQLDYDYDYDEDSREDFGDIHNSLLDEINLKNGVDAVPLTENVELDDINNNFEDGDSSVVTSSPEDSPLFVSETLENEETFDFKADDSIDYKNNFIIAEEYLTNQEEIDISSLDIYQDTHSFESKTIFNDNDKVVDLSALIHNEAKCDIEVENIDNDLLILPVLEEASTFLPEKSSGEDNGEPREALFFMDNPVNPTEEIFSKPLNENVEKNSDNNLWDNGDLDQLIRNLQSAQTSTNIKSADSSPQNYENLSLEDDPRFQANLEIFKPIEEVVYDPKEFVNEVDKNGDELENSFFNPVIEEALPEAEGVKENLDIDINLSPDADDLVKNQSSSLNMDNYDEDLFSLDGAKSIHSAVDSILPEIDLNLEEEKYEKSAREYFQTGEEVSSPIQKHRGSSGKKDSKKKPSSENQLRQRNKQEVSKVQLYKKDQNPSFFASLLNKIKALFVKPQPTKNEQNIEDMEVLSLLQQPLDAQSFQDEDIFINSIVTGTVSGENVTLNRYAVAKGGVKASGRCVCLPMSSVVGEIFAETVIIQGTVRGNVKATKSVLVKDEAIIYGDVYAPIIAVEDLAIVEGSLYYNRPQ